jgi:hypothetical protein
MRYMLRFAGGPMDGGRERLPGKHYNTRIARQLLQSGLINMAVYEYEQSFESPDETERIYRFVHTRPVNEAINDLGTSETL